MIQRFLITTGLVVAGYYVAQRFVLKAGPDDDSGFIETKPGFGLDDLAVGATIAAAVIFGGRLLGKARK